MSSIFGTISRGYMVRDLDPEKDIKINDAGEVSSIKINLSVFVYNSFPDTRKDEVMYMNGIYWGPKKNWDGVLGLQKKDAIDSVIFEMNGVPRKNGDKPPSMNVRILDFELAPKGSGGGRKQAPQKDEYSDMADGMG